jgi:hypothetical protein
MLDSVPNPGKISWCPLKYIRETRIGAPLAGAGHGEDSEVLCDSLHLIVHTHLKDLALALKASETGVDQWKVEGNIERIAANEHKPLRQS